jgi:hypothetical protein
MDATSRPFFVTRTPFWGSRASRPCRLRHDSIPMIVDPPRRPSPVAANLALRALPSPQIHQPLAFKSRLGFSRSSVVAAVGRRRSSEHKDARVQLPNYLHAPPASWAAGPRGRAPQAPPKKGCHRPEPLRAETLPPAMGQWTILDTANSELGISK